MKLNLHQLAEDEVVFRFESDEDRIEFFKNIDSITTEPSWEIDYVVINNKNGITFYRDKSLVNKYYPTWKEIKERYMNDKEIEKLAKNIYKALTNTITDNQNELSQAIALLQSNGYKVEPPYISPTDEEIIARLKIDNKKHNGIFNYYIFYSSRGEYTWGADGDDERVLGVTYTTQSIAQQIVAELNEKRFVRVD